MLGFQHHNQQLTPVGKIHVFSNSTFTKQVEQLTGK